MVLACSDLNDFSIAFKSTFKDMMPVFCAMPFRFLMEPQHTPVILCSASLPAFHSTLKVFTRFEN